MKNLYYWLAICIGYCFGSVLYGYEIPRIVKKINICELSDDGNPGTYNAFRYGGFICGISVLIAELLKGFIPVFFSAKYIGRESVLFAFVMARINKAPSTIFLTASVFPLMPGANLYYMMYGCVKQNMALAIEHMILLVETCLMIVFGFLLVDIVSRIVMRILGQEYHIGKNQ